LRPIHVYNELGAKLSHDVAGISAPTLRAPSHTAKSRDHEIVRAQKKVSKGRPNTPAKLRSVVMDPRTEVICDRALNHMQALFMRVLTHDKIE
jgi:hypothetical protein